MGQSIEANRIAQFGALDFIAKQVVEGFIVGLHKSPFHGFSVEFAEHRLYNNGESIKHIDWKLYGRTDKLFIKRYEEETNLRCQLILDVSSSMYFPVKEKVSIDNPNKITFSVYAAAALIHLLKKQRDAFSLSLFSEGVELLTQSKSSSTHQKYLYGELEKLLAPRPINDQRKTSATKALHEIAEKIHKRSLIIIFSDMLDSSASADQLFSALQHLKHNKHEVILFHVVDKNKEIDFDFENRPYKFIDMEAGTEIKLTPSEVRELYIEKSRAFKNDLKLKCGQYGIEFIEADINRGFEQILLPYLLKREKLY
ncbi:MAG TPA: DUF58 domain-containing protein [Bacteroidales bacterium]|mgnify:CR=1 FL=1|nr:DUF58 domain-containing protein [Bacteroidales bacterium]HRX96537.1 DUF58 domain-containing protein [Bacteroidales bacterium]